MGSDRQYGIRPFTNSRPKAPNVIYETRAKTPLTCTFSRILFIYKFYVFISGDLAQTRRSAGRNSLLAANLDHLKPPHGADRKEHG